ncbi:MAG: ABC transporter substrate-binding protein [Microvirga sp.]|nr:ABC transporter substrate-binding protein [Microvirga sp.]
MEFAKFASDPKTLVIGYNGNIDQFTRSPLRPRARASAMRWMFSSLLRFDEDLNLVGDLARRWERSDDGLTLTFHLREDAEWHDGTPVTADDVVFTGEALQRPNRYFRNTLHLSTGEPATFRKIDSHTLEVRTPRPYAALPSYLTGSWASLFLVMPRHVVERVGEAGFEANPVGSGPFKFGRITNDGHAWLSANERYFGGAPLFDNVLLRLFEQGADRIAAFKRGELDLVIAPGRMFDDRTARQYGGRLESVRSNQIVHFGMNCRSPILSSVKVRQAVACAVDRPALVREMEGASGLPAFGPLGPPNWAHEPDVERHPYDPERARRLLSEEGWRPGADGILEKDGTRLSFSVIFVPDTWNIDYAGYAEGMRKHLAAVGIELLVKPVEYWSGMKPAWRNHEFDAFMFHDTCYNEPDLYWSWHSSMPRRPEGPDAPGGLPQYGYGVTGYANPEVDALIVEAREELDRKKRKALLSRAQKIMANEVASLWLFNFPYRSVVHDRLRGLSRPCIADATADLIVTVHPERLYKVASAFDPPV